MTSSSTPSLRRSSRSILASRGSFASYSRNEGCLKSNYLTGASACARKIVYELAKREGGEGDHYEDRIKSLKDKFPQVEPSFFDTLLTVQEVTSNKVHEEAYDGWESKHLRLVLQALQRILGEIYVLPQLRKEERENLLRLKEEILGTRAREEEDENGD